MEKYEVRYINNLFDLDSDNLVKQSKAEGFRFLERLIKDFKNGSNTFNHFGEALFGVFNEEGKLVAIGGLNKDPFSNGQCIGRLRRFYVDKADRRNGIGSLLVKSSFCSSTNFVSDTVFTLLNLFLNYIILTNFSS